MNHLLDQSLVGLLLLVSAGYALMRLGPKTLRMRILAGLSQVAARIPPMFGLSQWAKQFEAAAAKPKGACGGCDDCGTAISTGTAADSQSTPREINIPVGKIGRRS
jgi:hypothetical protein